MFVQDVQLWYIFTSESAFQYLEEFGGHGNYEDILPALRGVNVVDRKGNAKLYSDKEISNTLNVAFEKRDFNVSIEQ